MSTLRTPHMRTCGWNAGDRLRLQAESLRIPFELSGGRQRSWRVSLEEIAVKLVRAVLRGSSLLRVGLLGSVLLVKARQRDL